MRRIKRGADVLVLDWDEDGDLLESVWMFKGEYEFLERNEMSLAVEDSRSDHQFSRFVNVDLLTDTSPDDSIISPFSPLHQFHAHLLSDHPHSRSLPSPSWA